MRIGAIGNFYGNLEVKVENGKYYWGITNYDGVHWEEIPESLYLELVKFEEFKNNPDLKGKRCFHNDLLL